MLAVFLRDEEPAVDSLVGAVIAKFGGVVCIDGGSAPLTEARLPRTLSKLALS